MDELFIEDRITRCTPQTLYEALRFAWYEVFGDANPKHESLLVLLSQWALETGEGRSCHCWNVGNIKRVQGKKWTMLKGVWEILDSVPAGATSWSHAGSKFRVVFDPPHKQTHFMAFESLEEGAVEYLKKLHVRFYKSWPAVEAGDPSAFAVLLKAQRYYTASVEDYKKAMLRWFNAYAKSIKKFETVI